VPRRISELIKFLAARLPGRIAGSAEPFSP
jgi:hypothetical protein